MVVERPRTANSVVWKGTRARELTSSVRFSWDTYQTKLFEFFLKTVGLNFKNSDITPLLVQLHLDGYEDVENEDGVNVHDIIQVKVQRKLRNVADEMDLDTLVAASMNLKQSGPTNRHNHAEKAADKKLPLPTNKPATRNRPEPTLDFSAPRNEQNITPFKFEAGSNNDRSVKQEDRVFPNLDLSMLRSLPPTPHSRRIEFNTQETSSVHSRSRQGVVKRLSSSLSRLSLALEEVESAMGDIETEEGPEWNKVVEDLSLGIHDMKIDVSELRGLVKQRKDE